MNRKKCLSIEMSLWAALKNSMEYSNHQLVTKDSGYWINIQLTEQQVVNIMYHVSQYMISLSLLYFITTLLYICIVNNEYGKTK